MPHKKPVKYVPVGISFLLISQENPLGKMDDEFFRLHQEGSEKFGLVWYQSHEQLTHQLRAWGVPVDNRFVRYLCALAIPIALNTYQGESLK